MQARSHPGPSRSGRSASRLARAFLLVLPAGLLLALAVRQPEAGPALWAGAACLGLGGLLAYLTSRGGRDPVGLPIIMMHVLALGWLMVALPRQDDWACHLCQAVLLVVPVWSFGVQCLHDSGASAIRGARLIGARLQARRDWPPSLEQVRLLPEVQAFRESLHFDAAPALELLSHPRAAVRVAALAALAFRPVWRAGQTHAVLHLARRAPEAEVRAAAVNALANVEDRSLTEAVAELLRDPSPAVRQTASEALLWNTDQRWHWMRYAVRSALADPACQQDGALRLVGQPLGKDAVADLHGWATEKGVIALRAALTLGAHYGLLLGAGAEQAVVEKLRVSLAAPQTPAILRLELARLLYEYGELGERDLHRLLQPSMPAPVRLIAVEALLARGGSPLALAALHELARLPNREIALSTADVVQRRLGVDLGLPRDQALPAVQTRQAAEVARRVLMWAANHDAGEDGDADSGGHGSRVELG